MEEKKVFFSMESILEVGITELKVYWINEFVEK